MTTSQSPAITPRPQPHKNTQGKWHAKFNNDHGYIEALDGNNLPETVVTVKWAPGDERKIADTHLLAAAKDLRDVLEVMIFAMDVHGTHHFNPTIIQIARDALAKASGTTTP